MSVAAIELGLFKGLGHLGLKVSVGVSGLGF